MALGNGWTRENHLSTSDDHTSVHAAPVQRPETYLQLVEYLSTGPDAVGEILAVQETAAFLRIPDGSMAVIILPSKRGPELVGALRELVNGDKSAHFKLVILGGGVEMQQALTKIQPGFLARRAIQVFQIGDDRTVWAGDASPLKAALGQALQRFALLRDLPPVDVEAFVKRLPVHTKEDVEAAHEHNKFVRAFKGGRPLLTYGVLAALAVVFGLEMLFGGAELIPVLLRMGANTSASLGAEPWRLLASVGLHGSVAHFGVNCFVLYILGGQLERILGWSRMAILLVASGLVGAVASAAVGLGAVSVGASGAIWGVLAAAGVLSLRPGGVLPPQFAEGMRRAAGANLVINLVASFLPGVDFVAHFGGGVAGALLILTGVLTRGLPKLADTEPQEQQPPQPPSRGLRLGAGACLLAWAVSLATSIAIGRPWEFLGEPTMLRHELAGTEFSIEVPAYLGPATVDPSQQVFVFGDALHDLVVVQVVVGDHAPATSEVPSDLEREAFFETDVGVPKGMTRFGKRRLVRDVERPRFEETYDAENGLRLTVQWVWHPEVFVRVEVACWGDAACAGATAIPSGLRDR